MPAADPEVLPFLDALLKNIVFLICLLPLVGAALSLISARLGAAHVRSTAITNTLLTLSLSLLMVSNYRVESGEARSARSDVQMVSAFRWIGPLAAEQAESNPDPRARPHAPSLLSRLSVRFAVGVDGISLWPIVLTSLLSFVAVAASQSGEVRQPAAFYALLLSAQAALTCLFAALDVVLFSACLSLSLVPMYFLIGMWGGYERRAASRSFLLHNFGGSLLATAGLMAFVLLSQAGLRPPLNSMLTHLARESPRLVDMLRASDWSAAGGAMLIVLLAGLAVRLSAVPCHAWFVPAVVQSPLPAQILLCGLFPLTGLYSLAKFAAPLLADADSPLPALLQGAAVGGALYCGLLAVAQRDLCHLTCWTSLGAVHLSAAGVLSRTPAGTMGGFLLSAGTALAAAALLEQIGRRESLSPSSRTTLGEMLCAAALLAVPGTAGFAGALLSLLGLFDVNRLAAVGGLLAWLLSACAVIRTLSGSNGATQSLTPRHPSAAASGSHYVVLIVLLAIIVAVGIHPRLATDRMEASVSRLVDPTVAK